jgi:hypothetical protein
MRWNMLLILFFVIPVWAQQPDNVQAIAVVDDSTEEKVFFLKELDYWIDFTNEATFSDVSAGTGGAQFRTHDSYQNKDFRPDRSYWIRFPVGYHGSTKKNWLIEFYDQTIDLIEAHVPQPGGGYKKVVMGDHFPFYQRTFLHKNFEIPVVDMPEGATVVYYFKVRSHDFADIRIAFKSVDRFVFYTLNEYFLYGTFYGMILIIALYNLLVYIAIREIKNLYYIFFIVSVALYTLSLDGIGFQYLWPEYPALNDYAGGISLYMVIMWAIVFTRKFLSTASHAPDLDRALRWMMAARTVLFAVELFFFPQFFTYRNIEIIPLSLIFYTGIRAWIRGYRPARFFVIAYGVLFSGFFVRAMVYFNILPLTTLSHYSLHISFVLEMLFLTFALGDRIRILKDMRDRALRRTILQHEENMKLKDKVNRELENKVRERTLELDRKNNQLEESNSKLARQAAEINQINSMLDLDNWKLKNSLKEVLNERLLDKTMDYRQFKTIYPNTLACYRFLEEQKWPEAYRCRKCANQKYFNGAQKFARRCTRCGYNESITAFTIFHSIKFPIEKAFYIAYLCVSEKNNYTLEQLATQLGLTVNTVWGFKNKVLNRIRELENYGKKPHLSKWQEIIFLYDPRNERYKTPGLKKPEIA